MTEDAGPYPRTSRRARAVRPLDAARLEEMALGYVARFATTAKGLERYCRRKLRERGWAEDEPQPDVAGLVERFVRNGYVNDSEYARFRQGGLLRRGYGARRIHAALDHAGVAEDQRGDLDEGEARRAALRLARKRRFGPFGPDETPPADRALREKQVAAMIRAGHPLDSARELVDAPDRQSALEWAGIFDEEF
jgi:regulatory protein